MSTATKTKKVLLRAECVSPPSEIREITKARRAWLAEEAARINALPNREAQIVGNGSYQSISVYEIKTVEGRLRHRGNCQFCGASQVVQSGRLVSHGYSRPGWGYIFNECPGTGCAPLQIEEKITVKMLAEEKASVELWQTELSKRARALTRARTALYGGERRKEEGAIMAKPVMKLARFANEPTLAQREVYDMEMEAWSEKFPLTAAFDYARAQESIAERQVSMFKSRVRHFETLLSWGLLGTELRAEVVV